MQRLLIYVGLAFAILSADAISVHEGFTLRQRLPDDLVRATRAPRYSTSISARQGGSLISPDLAQHIRDTLTLWNVTGLSLAVVRRRSANSTDFDVETLGFGVKNLAGDPFTAEVCSDLNLPVCILILYQTAFPIASNSKAITAIATGLLVNNPAVPLEWKSKLHKVLNGFKMQDPVADKLTDLIDAMSHRTGLPSHVGVLGKRDSPNPDEISVRGIMLLTGSELTRLFCSITAKSAAISQVVNRVPRALAGAPAGFASYLPSSHAYAVWESYVQHCGKPGHPGLQDTLQAIRQRQPFQCHWHECNLVRL